MGQGIVQREYAAEREAAEMERALEPGAVIRERAAQVLEARLPPAEDAGEPRAERLPVRGQERGRFLPALGAVAGAVEQDYLLHGRS